ncbi:MAG: LysM peptidoglycan-binding domain-containing protein, partial [Vampirovibrionales bacterium]
ASLEQVNQQASQLGTQSLAHVLGSQGSASLGTVTSQPSSLTVQPLQGGQFPFASPDATHASGLGMPLGVQGASVGASVKSPKSTHKSSKLKELDILWSGTQQLFHHREDSPKHPFLYFISGFLAGVLVTLFVGFLFQPLFKQVVDGSQMLTASPEKVLQQAVTSPSEPSAQGMQALSQKPTLSGAVGATKAPATPSSTVADRVSASSSSANPPETRKEDKGLFSWMKPQAQTKPLIQTQPQPRKTYTVHQGDTLAGICLKVYKTSEPRVIDLVQKANGMTSPHQLQIDQTLILPPLGEGGVSSAVPQATTGVRSPQ